MIKFPISPIFIPANKLDYIDKALNSGADGIIFDLEDSILQEDKRSEDQEGPSPPWGELQAEEVSDKRFWI